MYKLKITHGVLERSVSKRALAPFVDNPDLVPSIHMVHNSSQSSFTLVIGDLMLSFGLNSSYKGSDASFWSLKLPLQDNSWYIYIHAVKTLIHL